MLGIALVILQKSNVRNKNEPSTLDRAFVSFGFPMFYATAATCDAEALVLDVM